jgi:hypothetical protein
MDQQWPIAPLKTEKLPVGAPEQFAPIALFAPPVPPETFVLRVNWFPDSVVLFIADVKWMAIDPAPLNPLNVFAVTMLGPLVTPDAVNTPASPA